MGKFVCLSSQGDLAEAPQSIALQENKRACQISSLSRDQPGAREESSELKAGLSLGPEERRLPVTEMDRGLFNDAEKGFRDSGWERAWPERGPGGQRM